MSKLVKENISDYLPAPSKEEIEKRIKNIEDPDLLLRKAIENNYLDIAKKAIEEGAEPDGHSYLHALYHKSFDIINFLLDMNIDIEDDTLARNIMINSAEYGELEVLRKIINYLSLFPNHLDDYNLIINSVIRATYGGQYEIIKYLVKKYGKKAIDQKAIDLAHSLDYDEILDFLHDKKYKNKK